MTFRKEKRTGPGNRRGKSLFDSSDAPTEDQIHNNEVTLQQRLKQKAEDSKQSCCG